MLTVSDDTPQDPDFFSLLKNQFSIRPEDFLNLPETMRDEFYDMWGLQIDGMEMRMFSDFSLAGA